MTQRNRLRRSSGVFKVGPEPWFEVHAVALRDQRSGILRSVFAAAKEVILAAQISEI